jgi:hypothetical protein
MSSRKTSQQKSLLPRSSQSPDEQTTDLKATTLRFTSNHFTQESDFKPQSPSIFQVSLEESYVDNDNKLFAVCEHQTIVEELSQYQETPIVAV